MVYVIFHSTDIYTTSFVLSNEFTRLCRPAHSEGPPNIACNLVTSGITTFGMIAFRITP